MPFIIVDGRNDTFSAELRIVLPSMTRLSGWQKASGRESRRRSWW